LSLAAAWSNAAFILNIHRLHSVFDGAPLRFSVTLRCGRKNIFFFLDKPKVEVFAGIFSQKINFFNAK